MLSDEELAGWLAPTWEEHNETVSLIQELDPDIFERGILIQTKDISGEYDTLYTLLCDENAFLLVRWEEAEEIQYEDLWLNLVSGISILQADVESDVESSVAVPEENPLPELIPDVGSVAEETYHPIMI